MAVITLSVNAFLLRLSLFGLFAAGVASQPACQGQLLCRNICYYYPDSYVPVEQFQSISTHVQIPVILNGTNCYRYCYTPQRVTCSNSQNISVNLFDSIPNSLHLLGCRDRYNSIIPNLLYTFIQPNAPNITVTQTDVFHRIFADYFVTGTYQVSIFVCIYNDIYRDSSFTGFDDHTALIFSSYGIPLWSKYYKLIFASTNGLISFDQPYVSPTPRPFPNDTATVPILAPYWADFDFSDSRSLILGSRLFSNVYDRNQRVVFDRRKNALLQEFTQRLATYSGIHFVPQWMTVITWSNAIPHGSTSDIPEVATFQLVLATDYVHTYWFYLYSYINWDYTLRAGFQDIAVGYNINNNETFFNVEPHSIHGYLYINSLLGNTNRYGQWFFSYMPETSELTDEQRCFQWANNQREDQQGMFDNLPSCPCSLTHVRLSWNFWFGVVYGFPSRPNCASLILSRGQSTTECCYDGEGTLIVDSSNGGSHQLYNPVIYPREHTLNDQLTYEQCCVQSDRCQIYRKHRPSYDCDLYVAPFIIFLFGHPHFHSMDGNSFTFNGIGEYLVLEAPCNQLIIQGRFVQYDNTNGSVCSAIAIKQGDAQTVQVEAQNSELRLLIDNLSVALPTNNSVIFITPNGTFSNLTNAGFGINDSSLDIVVLHLDPSERLLVTTSSGASAMIGIQLNNTLHATFQLSSEFENCTTGLLGTTDRDISNGQILNMTTEEEANIHQYGLQWHINETESLFYYTGNYNYHYFNNGSDDFAPTSFQERDVPTNAHELCEMNPECIYDYTVTGSQELGLSTLRVANEMSNLETILENLPPRITGETIIFVNATESIVHRYNVTDFDGDEINTFELRVCDAITGLTFVRSMSGSSGTLTWLNPGYSLPSSPIQLFTNDSKGASSTRRISVILCACDNGGTCLPAGDNPPLNENGHYKQTCDCLEYFGGSSCEIEMRGCNFSTCPDYAECVENSMIPQGYECFGCDRGYFTLPGLPTSTCVDVNECITAKDGRLPSCSGGCVNTVGSFVCNCATGYQLDATGRSCEDIDECTNSTESQSCSQICINTQGSYDCGCHNGYMLAADGEQCIDVNECITAEGGSLPSCSGGCVNTEGSFICNCATGYQLDTTGRSCEDINECTESHNCSQICINSEGGYNCQCSHGYMLATNREQCLECPAQRYGFECSQTCFCMNGGTCDSVRGCFCTVGWTGINCTEEANNFDPVFNLNTPTVVAVQSNLKNSSIILNISATDNDIGPNAGRVSYQLVDSPFPLPSFASNGLELFTIDNGTGIISVAVDLEQRNNSIRLFVLTIEARDNSINPRSSLHQLRVEIVSDTPTTCSQTCFCMNGGMCDSTGRCLCSEEWTGMNCTEEANNFDPVFNVVTPTVVLVQYNSSNSLIILKVSATDNDIGPNSGRVSYYLVDSPFPLPSFASNGLEMFTIDNGTGIISLAVDLEQRNNSLNVFVLTIQARDNGINPRSSLHQFTVEIAGPSTETPKPTSLPMPTNGTIISFLPAIVSGTGVFAALMVLVIAVVCIVICRRCQTQPKSVEIYPQDPQDNGYAYSNRHIINNKNKEKYRCTGPETSEQESEFMYGDDEIMNAPGDPPW